MTRRQAQCPAITRHLRSFVAHCDVSPRQRASRALQAALSVAAEERPATSHDPNAGYNWIPRAHPPTSVIQTYTQKTLSPHNGQNGARILLAIKGMVFDVTAGGSFCGPDGAYGNFAGRDASRGMAKQSFDNEMLTSIDHPHKLEDLTPSQI